MPPIRKNGCGKQLPQPKTHTTPADRQAMTTHRAERYANFPRKAQQTGRSAPPDTMSYRSSAGNQVHPLNSSLVFSYPTTRAAKKQPRPLPAALSAFWRTAKKNSTIAKMWEKVQLPSPAMFAVKKEPDTRLSMSLFFGCCGRRIFCVWDEISKNRLKS